MTGKNRIVCKFVHRNPTWVTFVSNPRLRGEWVDVPLGFLRSTVSINQNNVSLWLKFDYRLYLLLSYRYVRHARTHSVITEGAASGWETWIRWQQSGTFASLTRVQSRLQSVHLHRFLATVYKHIIHFNYTKINNVIWTGKIFLRRLM